MLNDMLNHTAGVEKMNGFGEFLYRLRKEKGMTQAELADALGVTNKAVSKWETGEAMPETALLKPLARIFGVTVDELLDGKRADGNACCYNEESRSTADGEKYSNTREEDIDEFFTRRIKEYVFARGRDCGEERTVSDRICGAVCAAVVLLGIAVYLFLGSLADLWHPYWVIIPVCALASGIVGILFDVCNKQKRERKIARGEKPVTGAICGIVMLCCIIAYLLLGAFANLWHPMWMLVVCGAVASGIIGATGEAIAAKKRNK